MSNACYAHGQWTGYNSRMTPTTPTFPLPDTDRAREIRDSVLRAHESIADALRRAGRPDDSITLCAVTKTRPVSDCLAAIAAGVSDIGENYVQEAREKVPQVRAALSPGQAVTCHLIGHLQTNKIKDAVGFTDIFQTVDSMKQVNAIANFTQKLYNAATIGNPRFQTARVLIEINIADSDNRAGIAPDAALDFVAQVIETPGIVVCGLMGMAPIVGIPDAARPYFARLKQLFDALPVENRQILSMGMSGDYEAAIAEGATLVRLGTALFGARV